MSLIRGLDGQRRLTIPKETLRAIGAEPGDYLKVYAGTTPQGATCVIVEKFEPGCALCGGSAPSEFKIINGKRVCKVCTSTLR